MVHLILYYISCQEKYDNLFCLTLMLNTTSFNWKSLALNMVTRSWVTACKIVSNSTQSFQEIPKWQFWLLLLVFIYVAIRNGQKIDKLDASQFCRIKIPEGLNRACLRAYMLNHIFQCMKSQHSIQKRTGGALMWGAASPCRKSGFCWNCWAFYRAWVPSIWSRLSSDCFRMTLILTYYSNFGHSSADRYVFTG